MKRILSFTLSFLICGISLCQDALEHVPNITTPNAASFAKYGEVPVSHYTGIPDISIPLHTVKDGQVEIPIVLRYHAGGIKVEEEASWVGLGWNLNMGGSINRIVNGMHDEIYYNDDNTKPFLVDGKYQIEIAEKDFYARSIKNWRSPLVEHIDGSCTVESSTLKYSHTIIPDHEVEAKALFADDVAITRGHTTLGSMMRGFYKPDLFSFNFLGHSGKFYIDHSNNTAYQIDGKHALQITPITGENCFEIIDESGIKYTFNQVVQTTYSGTNYGEEGPTTTYLSQIEYPNSEIITFSYETVSEVRSTNIESEFFSYSEVAQSPGNLNCLPYFHATGYERNPPKQYNRYSPKYIKQIQTKNFTIIFNRNSVREDLPGEHSLKEIIVSDHFGNEKKYSFNYSYFDNLSYHGFNDNRPSVRERYFKRLKLNSVKEEGKQPYIFSYNEEVNLPPKDSYARDYWGYYNGIDENATLIPSIRKLKRHNPEFFELYEKFSDLEKERFMRGNEYFYLANRAIDSDYVQANILTAVEYPLGGKTEYDYESNEISNLFYEPVNPIFNNIRLGFFDNIVPARNGNPGNDVDLIMQSEPFQVDKALNAEIVGQLSGATKFMSLSSPYDDTKAQRQSRMSGSYIKFINETDPSQNFTYTLPTVPENEDPYENKEYVVHFSKYVKLVPGHTYRFELFKPKIQTIENLAENDFYRISSFIEVDIYPQSTNSAGPGVRVKNIRHFNNNGILSHMKSYEYSQDGRSTGRLMAPVMFFEKKHIRSIVSTEIYDLTLSCRMVARPSFIDYPVYMIHANSNIPLSPSAQGNFVGYDLVIEKNSYFEKDQNPTNNNLNGSIEYIFENLEASAGVGLPNVPNLMNGFMKEATYKDINGDIKKHEIFEYAEIIKRNNFGIHTKQIMNTFAGAPIADNALLMFYRIPASWYRTSYSITKEYLDKSYLETRTDYEYNEIGQLISTRTKTSDNQKIISEIYYPYDLKAINALALQMFNDHVLSPILLKEDYKNGNPLLNKSTSYNWHSFGATKAYYPSLVEQYTKSPDDKTRVHYSFNTDLNVVEAFKEVNNVSNIPTSIYWGYNNNLPVIKASNVNSATLNAAVSNVISNSVPGHATLESFLVSLGRLESSTEKASLQSFVDALRTELGSMVNFTMVTYMPLCGITSQTDLNGKTVYYEYDALERLKTVKDHEGNILNRNDYYFQQ